VLSYSRHAGALAESETLAITAHANRLRSEGIEVAPFAVGEPDFPTPAHVQEAGIRAIREGRTKYAPPAGIAPLRAAVAAEMVRAGLAGTTAERTVVGVGTKGVLFLAFQVLVQEGDEVLIPSPCWLSYPKMVQAVGGKVRFVETRPEEGFAVDPERVAAAVTPRTKVLVLNSPCNPTGAVQPDDVQTALGRLAEERGFVVISDEIYDRLTYAPARFRSFAALAPEARERTLIVNGVSKAYAMTGWRIGWGAGPQDLVQRMVRVQSHALTGPPDFCQRAALAALTGPQDEVESMRRAFEERAASMHRAMAAIPDVRVRKPLGAFYLLPDVSAYLGRRLDGRVLRTPTDLAAALIETARVAVVPGEVFEAPYALRFSYACGAADIERGMARTAALFAALR
jgi:aspartate aminotransferase